MYYTTTLNSAPREIDCFTIALGKKTGTTFPVDIHDQKVIALYDTGAGCSLINYSMYEKLGMNIDKGYQPTVKSSTGEDMGALGQVTFTFKINNTPFTQSFIVCRHMTRHMILGTDFTAMNFIGAIWTREGTWKLMHSNGKTIIELPDSTSGVPLVLGHSVKIHPGSHLTVPLECTRPVTDRMDIRMDIGFHHRNPNVYIHPSFVNNPNNKYNPKFIPLAIFNPSRVDHLYIGRDVPEFETYNVEIASEDKIKEHLAKPRDWVSQKHEILPEIPSDTAFICSPADNNNNNNNNLFYDQHTCVH